MSIDKLAQKRDLRDRVREKLDLGTRTLSLFDKQFADYMRTLRDADDSARQQASELKPLLKTTKTLLAGDDYFAAAAKLASFYSIIEKMLSSFDVLTKKLTDERHKLLVDHLDDDTKSDLVKYFKRNKKSQSEVNLLIKQANVLDWFAGKFNARRRALKALEKRVPQLKDLRKSIKQQYDAAESLFDVMTKIFSTLSKARSKGDINAYHVALNEMNRVVQPVKNKFDLVYDKNVEPLVSYIEEKLSESELVKTEVPDLATTNPYYDEKHTAPFVKDNPSTGKEFEVEKSSLPPFKTNIPGDFKNPYIFQKNVQAPDTVVQKTENYPSTEPEHNRYHPDTVKEESKGQIDTVKEESKNNSAVFTNQSKGLVDTVLEPSMKVEVPYSNKLPGPSVNISTKPELVNQEESSVSLQAGPPTPVAKTLESPMAETRPGFPAPQANNPNLIPPNTLPGYPAPQAQLSGDKINPVKAPAPETLRSLNPLTRLYNFQDQDDVEINGPEKNMSGPGSLKVGPPTPKPESLTVGPPTPKPESLTVGPPTPKPESLPMGPPTPAVPSPRVGPPTPSPEELNKKNKKIKRPIPEKLPTVPIPENKTGPSLSPFNGQPLPLKPPGKRAELVRDFIQKVSSLNSVSEITHQIIGFSEKLEDIDPESSLKLLAIAEGLLNK